MFFYWRQDICRGYSLQHFVGQSGITQILGLRIIDHWAPATVDWSSWVCFCIFQTDITYCISEWALTALFIWPWSTVNHAAWIWDCPTCCSPVSELKPHLAGSSGVSLNFILVPLIYAGFDVAVKVHLTERSRRVLISLKKAFHWNGYLTYMWYRIVNSQLANFQIVLTFF